MNEKEINDTIVGKIEGTIPASENELAKENELTQLLLAFYQKTFDENAKAITHEMFDPNFKTYIYVDGCGYYAIKYGHKYDTKHYPSLNEAFINIAEIMLHKKSADYERKNHKELKRDFKKRFENQKYIFLIAEYEYELSKWNKYFDGNIPEEVIDGYDKGVNVICLSYDINLRVAFNPTTMKFEKIARPKVRERK